MNEQNFATCRCGKEWPIKDLLASIGDLFLCGACSAEVNQGLDKCPETLLVNEKWGENGGWHGSAACRLGWHHVGRCEPEEIDAELLKLLH